MNKLIQKILAKVSLFSVLGLAMVSTSFAQVTVGAYFGWNQTTIPVELTNAVDAFQTGAVANANIALDGSANDFNLTFTEGLNVGTARFVVTDNYGNQVSGNHVLRQFRDGIEGPGTSAGQLTITLASVTNLSAICLSRVQITGTGVNQYTSTLPSSVSSTAFNTAITPIEGAWSVGQSLVISHLSVNANTFTVQGINLSGTPMIPEPSSAAALAGLAALGMVAVRRRRR